MVIAEPRGNGDRDLEHREEGGGKRAPRKALEMVEGEPARKKLEIVAEGGRQYEPGRHAGEGVRRRAEAEVVLNEEKEEGRLKGDLYQRKLFSETRKQNKPAEQENLLMEKPNTHHTAQTRNQHPPSPVAPQRQHSPVAPQRQHSPVAPQRYESQRVRRAWERGPVSNEEGFPHTRTFEVDLGGFDPGAYLSGQLLEEGGDEMKRFQFNQRRSEMTPYDRPLKDVRNPRYSPQV